MGVIETASRIEPTLLDEANAEILDLVAELSRTSERALGGQFDDSVDRRNLQIEARPHKVAAPNQSAPCRR
jgi:hypothetical protein